MARLSEGPASMSTLAEPFDMALPSFAQHLKVLEDCGLIVSEKRGRSRWCRLVRGRFEEAADWMEAERRRWTGRMDRLEAYLDAAQQDEAEKDDAEKDDAEKDDGRDGEPI